MMNLTNLSSSVLYIQIEDNYKSIDQRSGKGQWIGPGRAGLAQKIQGQAGPGQLKKRRAGPGWTKIIMFGIE